MARVDLVPFIGEFAIQEDGLPFHLEDHQGRILGEAFRFGPDGRLQYRTVIYSAPKKSGKTAINGLVCVWWAFCVQPPDEIIIASNDLDQSISRVFDAARGFIERNPALKGEAGISKALIRLSNGSIIRAIPADYTGEAGANQGLASFDELWGFMSERSRRLYEELTPVPTRRNSNRFVTTYAGWTGDSVLLESYYERIFDKQGNVKPGVNRPLGEGLPVYTIGDLFVYWDHLPRMPWQTAAYYESQRADLRPNTFARLHRNEWTSNESSFFDMAAWDSCVSSEHRPPAPDPRLQIWVGCDASVKRDRSAVVSIYRWGGRYFLGLWASWQPSKEEPLDLEASMEAYIKMLAKNYEVVEILYDPFQFHRSATTLRQLGINMREFPQTQNNLTDAGQALFDAVKNRTLTLYPDRELRQAASFAVAKETPRGFRIVKEKAAHKIDPVVALAFALFGATTAPELENAWELPYRGQDGSRGGDNQQKGLEGFLHSDVLVERMMEGRRERREAVRTWFDLE